MILSELVAYRRHLDEITQDGSEQYLQREIDPVIFSVSNWKYPNGQHIDSLQTAKSQILNGLDQFCQAVNHIKQDVQKEIEQQQSSYFAKSYGLYQDMQQYDSVEYILKRRIQISNQTKDFVLSRIRRRDTWKHPAMIIRPGLEEWIDHMVAFDPLYAVDQHADLLIPTRSRFNEIYANRVRWAVISEKENYQLLNSIPTDQIGFCMAWNFFHYKPFEIIKQYITEIYTKLRPGGVFAFSVNDGDLAGGVANAERIFMCYTPGSMIISISERIGFQLCLRHELDKASTWIELQKPGEKQSLRGGQALASVIPKPVILQPVVDTASGTNYTNSEREMLVQQVIDLNIDDPDTIRNHYTMKQLKKIIKKRKLQ